MGLSNITVEKGICTTHNVSRRFCLAAAAVSEPRGGTRGAGTQTSKGAIPTGARVSEEVWRLFCKCCKITQTGFSCYYWNEFLLPGLRNKARVMLTREGTQNKNRKQSRKGQVLSSSSQVLNWLSLARSQLDPTEMWFADSQPQMWLNVSHKLRDNTLITDIDLHPIVSLFLPVLGILM